MAFNPGTLAEFKKFLAEKENDFELAKGDWEDAPSFTKDDAKLGARAKELFGSDLKEVRLKEQSKFTQWGFWIAYLKVEKTEKVFPIVAVWFKGEGWHFSAKEEANLELEVWLRSKLGVIDPKKVALPDFCDKAKKLIFEGKFKDALAKYEVALKIDSNHLPALYGKGIALDWLGKIKTAAGVYAHVISGDSKFADAWLGAGSSFYILKKVDEAEKAYSAYLVQKNSPHGWYLKGLLFYVRGDFKEAVSCFNKALEINKEFTDALNAKSRALIMIGRAAEEEKGKEGSAKYYDKALEIAQQVLSKDSDDSVALSNAANAFIGLGKKKEADESWGKVVAAFEKKKLDSAPLEFPKDELLPALGARHKRATEWNALGLAQSALGKDDGAVSSFGNAIKNDRYFIDAWFNRGLALYAQEKLIPAIKCFEFAYGINPKFPFLEKKKEEAILAAVEAE